MFRHDIREKPVLYKEILKAISKRELLEDLCFCACRKIFYAGVYRLASDLFRLWVASRSAAHNAAKRNLFTVGIVPGFGLDVSQAQRIIAVGKSPLRCARDVTMFPTI
ncbi:TPA: hypothetical protein ACTYSZ_002520 [Klebsiella aerogenes]